MIDSIERLIRETLTREVSPTIILHNFEERMIRPGMSGAALRKFELFVSDASISERLNLSLVVKESSWVERRVLDILYKQKMNVPFNFTFNLTSDVPDFICLQDLGSNHIPDPLSISDDVLKKEAYELARIHATNLHQDTQYAWLPRIDRRFIETWLQVGWKGPWQEVLQNEEFIDVFRSYISQIEQSAQHIVEDMNLVIRDSDFFSLIHTDLHGGNVLVDNDEVYFIDWAEAHYGSIILDLPHNFCTRRHVQHYVEALNDLGVRFPETTFYEQYQICRRYIGLRYMGWLLHIWRHDKGATNWIIHQMNMAIE